MTDTTELRKILASAFAALVVAASGLQAADSKRQYVNGQVWQSGSGSYHAYQITEYTLGISLWANSFANGLSFSGRPFSGMVSGSGSFYSVNGGGLNATVSAWGGNYSVNGTYYPQGGGPSQRLSFTMNAMGRTDDPENPPSYNVYDYASGASLNLSPFGHGGYSISGWIDTEKFGAHGTALVGLIAALSVETRPAPQPKPKAPEQPAPGRKLSPLPLPL